MGRVIVVGSINEDLVLRAPIPAPGETVATTSPSELLGGGKGANAAVAAAALGAETYLVGCVGDDAAGARWRAALRDDGVRDDWLATAPGVGTGRAVVVVDGAGENAIVVDAAANAALEPAWVHEAIDALAAPGAVVLANLEIPVAAAEAAARAATEHGLRFVLDPAPARPLGAGLIPDGAILAPNEHELAQLGGTPEELLARGAGAVVVTRGAHGAVMHGGGDDAAAIPAPTVDAVDTTGAGDAFRGALAAALAAGDDLAAAVGVAVCAGAHATTAPGARGAVADRAALAALSTG
ncbi:PfkB family carbohydrate kinase [Baekduia sp. Peel2402]|uniref:PfkB family carbohydrate kinase n=1 Tax=Baekduia sp. Peel2402 TaxID=3458296 RepID=UPI00403EE5B5